MERHIMKKIGMIGIGLMGHGIASNLVKKGQSLTVLEHPGNQPLDGLKAAGATSVNTPKELAAQVDVLILCVTGTPQVEAVLTGDDGVLKGMRPGTIIIDCSTAVPASTERMAKLVHDAGGRFVDSPMTRTPKEAAEGRLNLLVGGDKSLFEEVRPILACFAENITYSGPVGSGHIMKLLHNYVSLGTLTLIAEAAATAKRLGIDTETFVQVLEQGGGHGAALTRIKPYLLSGDAGNMRFSISNAHKDLGYYNQMTEDAKLDNTIAEAVMETLGEAKEQGDPNGFLPEMATRIAARKA
jgi:3-hydroxyisobutyrate dehydrogenase-like beta-hydroxyacid dehydrogenase